MRTLDVLFVVVLLAAVSLKPAHAYLDPSSSSMLMQFVLGGIAGIGALLKMLWTHVRTRGLARAPKLPLSRT